MNTGSENTQAKANDSTSAPAPVPPPELMHMHAKELLQILNERHIDHTAVVEKPELVDLILERCTH
ncbi:hypothetical protein BGX24_011930 [Mortierella sp. AD032]|nr:hypothetical protein BGX24_011930 [Mortierella sp. AD032]